MPQPPLPTSRQQPVAVTGLGVVCPIGHDVASFIAALRAGRSGIALVPDPMAPGGARLVAPVGDFDLAAALDGCAGLAPATRREALRAARRSPLPVQVALAAAAQAWQDADLDARRVPGDRVGLVVGGHNLTAWYAFDLYPTYLRKPAYLPARYALHVQDTDHVGTLSQALRITGEGYTVGASSASGNASLIQAARLIGCGAVEVCLAVGAMARLGPPERHALAKLGILAEPGDPACAPGGCRPFDQRRSGLVPGEGAACLVLESRASAARRRVRVLAELAGYAAALDGNSLSDPSVACEARVMDAALAQAGAIVSDVDYVNAHATATPAGDDAELRALCQVFGEEVGRPWLNSTKALVGHCLSAAGAVEAVATVVQMRGGFVHANPSLSDPVDQRYRLVGRSAAPARIDCALSNGFGFGGFNSCLLLRGGE